MSEVLFTHSKLGEVTVKLTRNDDGWWTAQIVEQPTAISQGQTAPEACWNVLLALSDLAE